MIHVSLLLRLLYQTCSTTLPDQLEDFWFLHFSLLHALLHRRDYGVGLILGAVL